MGGIIRASAGARLSATRPDVAQRAFGRPGARIGGPHLAATGPAGLLLITFLLVGAAVLALAPAALAAKRYKQVQFAQSFSFLLAESVAVNDNNGHIYVADSGSAQVLDFTSPSDTSPTVWNGSNTPAGSFGGEHVSVAADNSTGDVYVADRGHAVIDKFDQDGNLITSFGDTTPSPNGQLAGAVTPAGSFSPAGSGYSSFAIAVDQATHDLYAIDAHHQVIDVFDQNGAYLRQITATPTGLYRYGGDYTLGIAVDSSGTVYVSDWAGPNLVFQFDSSGNHVKTLDGSNTPDGNFSGGCTGCSLISVATEDSTGKLFVGAMAHSDFDVFDSSGNFIPPQGFFSGFGPSGIAVDQSSGDVYLSSYGSIVIFTPFIAPDVTTNPVSNVTATTATVNGHVDPAGGGDITGCHFEYGTDTTYSLGSVPCSPATPLSSPTDVSAPAVGLTPGTRYYYRLVVSNANGPNEAASQFTSVGRYQFSTDFGSAGAGDGQLTNPQDVAVDNLSGDLYVADTGNHRVVKLDSSGHFLAAWGWGVKDGSAASEVCTSGCQVGISGSGAGQFASPAFVEVDNSTGPSSGDVYVADTADGVVQKFDPAGNLITTWGTGGATHYSEGIAGIAVDSAGGLIVQPGSGTGIAVDSFGHVFSGQTGIAIDTSINEQYADTGAYIQASNAAGAPTDTFGEGNLHSAAGLAFNQSTRVLYAANSGDNNIAVFSPRSLPNVTTNPVTTQSPTSATLTGHVDPAGGGDITDCHFEYGTDTTYSLGSVPCSPATPLSSPTDVSADLSGLVPFTSYHYRLVAKVASDYGMPSYSRDRTFTPAPSLPPGVDATSASDLAPTTATLNAQINPNLAPTIYRFQYGTDTSYGSQTLAGESIGSDGIDHGVSSPISGLQPGTTYHFRVVAVNFNGLTGGPDQTFDTPDLPAVAAGAASEITQATATLSASIRPGFRATTYHFEYGLTAAYGSRTPESASLGSDNSAHSASAPISGLTAGTIYHFRVVATNVIGTTSGPDQTFTTASSTPIVTPPPPLLTCKKGFVKRHGKCVKKPHHKRKHHRGSH